MRTCPIGQTLVLALSRTFEPRPSTLGSIPIALAGPYLEMGPLDVDMSALDCDFQMHGAVGIPGKEMRNKSRAQEYWHLIQQRMIIGGVFRAL